MKALNVGCDGWIGSLKVDERAAVTLESFAINRFSKIYQLKGLDQQGFGLVPLFLGSFHSYTVVICEHHGSAPGARPS
jgi:hypothetical protein